MHFKPHKHELYLFNREIEKKDKTEERERRKIKQRRERLEREKMGKKIDRRGN